MINEYKKVMGSPFVTLVEGYGIGIEDDIRFISVAARLQERREARGMTLKEAAAALRVPQYRLRDIESGSVKRLAPNILVAYVNYLDLKQWFGRWKKVNFGVVNRIGV